MPDDWRQPGVRAALRALARDLEPGLVEGVYAGLPGPHFETPAEIRMLRTIGADLVGMSTVHETIAARAAGAAVLSGAINGEGESDIVRTVRGAGYALDTDPV